MPVLGGVGMGRLGVLGGHQGSGLSEGSGPICHVLICSWDWMSALSSPMATSRTVGLLQSLSGGEKKPKYSEPIRQKTY